MVEHSLSKREVIGSTPVGGLYFLFYYNINKFKQKSLKETKKLNCKNRNNLNYLICTATFYQIILNIGKSEMKYEK